MLTSAALAESARAAARAADTARAEASKAQAALVANLPVPGAYRAFKPSVGDMLVVQLPGETMRCPVSRVVDADTVLVKIDTVPMAKTHTFRLDEVVGVRRRVRNGRDVWEAQPEREFLAEQERLNPKPAPKRPVAAGKKGRARR